MPVTQDRAHGFLAAVATVGADDRQATSGRPATLCGSPDDLARHDQVFAAWFDPRDGLPRAQQRESSRPRPRAWVYHPITPVSHS